MAVNNVNKDEVWDFLDTLRDSGETNMWGAGPYVAHEFGISYEEGNDLLLEWIKSFDKS